MSFWTLFSFLLIWLLGCLLISAAVANCLAVRFAETSILENMIKKTKTTKLEIHAWKLTAEVNHVTRSPFSFVCCCKDLARIMPPRRAIAITSRGTWSGVRQRFLFLMIFNNLFFNFQADLYNYWGDREKWHLLQRLLSPWKWRNNQPAGMQRFAVYRQRRNRPFGHLQRLWLRLGRFDRRAQCRLPPPYLICTLKI